MSLLNADFLAHSILGGENPARGRLATCGYAISGRRSMSTSKSVISGACTNSRLQKWLKKAPKGSLYLSDIAELKLIMTLAKLVSVSVD